MPASVSADYLESAAALALSLNGAPTRCAESHSTTRLAAISAATAQSHDLRAEFFTTSTTLRPAGIGCLRLRRNASSLGLTGVGFSEHTMVSRIRIGAQFASRQRYSRLRVVDSLWMQAAPREEHR